MISEKGFSFFRWLIQQKYYFDKGLNLFGYLKYVIVAIGISFKDIYLTIILGFLTTLICYILGLAWTKNRLADIENDVANQYNPFVRDTLKHLSKNKKFK